MHDSAQHVTPVHGSVPMALRIPEVALQIGVTRRQVYRLMTAGEIPFVLIGSSRRVLRVDLEAYLQSKRQIGDVAPVKAA